jgi:hypothetical protein
MCKVVDVFTLNYVRQVEAEFRTWLIGLGFKHMGNGTFLGDVQIELTI